MTNIVDFKKPPSKTEVKVFCLNNDIAEMLSRYEEEEQVIAVFGVLLEMCRKNPTLKESFIKVLEKGFL